MKQSLFLIFMLAQLAVIAQTKGKPITHGGGKYFTFNPFGLAEPQMAVGFGFGNHFGNRSEYFSELSYITKTPFYNYEPESLNGVKLIAQYRYHFFRGTMLRDKRFNSFFLGFEFRIKNFRFTDREWVKNTINGSVSDSFLYKATAFTYGGAVIAGWKANLGRRSKWGIEFTIGIGARAKTVQYHDIPNGLKIQASVTEGLQIPAINEEIGMPYFPCAIRILYKLK